MCHNFKNAIHNFGKPIITTETCRGKRGKYVQGYVISVAHNDRNLLKNYEWVNRDADAVSCRTARV